MGIDGKIQALNEAIKEAIPHMQTVAGENPKRRNFGARHQVLRWRTMAHRDPGPGGELQMDTLSSDGVTDMGKALSMVADQLKSPPCQTECCHLFLFSSLMASQPTIFPQG